MLTTVKKLDKVYGGYDYIEYSDTIGEYRLGNTRSHTGYSTCDTITIEVSTKKELANVLTQLQNREYTKRSEKF